MNLWFQGKPTEASIEAKILGYGELESKDYIPGAEVLEVEQEEGADEGTCYILRPLKVFNIVLIPFFSATVESENKLKPKKNLL